MNAIPFVGGVTSVGFYGAGRAFGSAIDKMADAVGNHIKQMATTCAKIWKNLTNKSVPVNNPEAHNFIYYTMLKEQYRVAELGNSVVESLQATGELPSIYITKAQAETMGWRTGKALNNFAPGKAIGGDVFENSTGVYYLMHQKEYGMN